MARKRRDLSKSSRVDSSHLREASEEKFLSARQLKWSISILFVYFGLRLLFFAVTINPFVPPDEHTHFEICRIFSKVFFLPENSPETYEFGLVTNIPWLYYWVTGKLLALNVFGMPDLLFLRLLNIPFAFATAYYVWKSLRLLTDDRLSQLLLIVAVTNTIMFTFLSAFVSYDNLTNLLAAMSVYYMLAFFQSRSGDLLAASFLCQMAGMLTKTSFLPLALILDILLVIHEFKSLRLLPGALVAWLKAWGWRRAALVSGAVLGLALNIQLYGGNYLHYGDVAPKMSEVLSLDKALQNRLQAREEIFTLFKEGRVSREQALAMASQITQPNDRAEAINLIENYVAIKDHRIELIGPLNYLFLWMRRMMQGVFGIFAHLMMPNRGPLLWLFFALIALSILAIIVRWRPPDAGWLPACLLATAVSYVLFLAYFVNYRNYLFTGVFGLGLQGRYIFPVLGPIYAVSSYYLPRLFRSDPLRLGAVAAACVLFIASDFPFFLLHVTPEWFIPSFRY